MPQFYDSKIGDVPWYETMDRKTGFVNGVVMEHAADRIGVLARHQIAKMLRVTHEAIDMNAWCLRHTCGSKTWQITLSGMRCL